MRIEMVSIDEVCPNEWNPNEMDDQIYTSLVESIRRYGILQPILIRSDMTIIKDEKRWKAAKEVGINELLPVIVETSEEEAKLLKVSLSKLRVACWNCRMMKS